MMLALVEMSKVVFWVHCSPQLPEHEHVARHLSQQQCTFDSLMGFKLTWRLHHSCCAFTADNQAALVWPFVCSQAVIHLR